MGAINEFETEVSEAEAAEAEAAEAESAEAESSEAGAPETESLDSFFARTPRLAVAFSGGCDSAYLLAAAHDAGCQVKAYLVKSAFQAPFELEDALAVARALDVPFEVIDLDILSGGEEERAVCANPPERCYLCKRLIFSAIGRCARADGFGVLADGTNASDDPARRPGFRALAELGVASPLRRAGMTKDAVRAASAELERRRGLASGALMSSKPSFPCLAVFVPEGEPITQASLGAAARRLDARRL